MLLLYITVLLTMMSSVNSIVYDVTPDDNKCDYNYCQDLQYYLLNVVKSFASNTQLNFLPGLHHLPTDLIIQNVHNISLIGSTTNGLAPDTIIQCTSSVGFIMTNITNLTVQNVVIRNCRTIHHSLQAAVYIKGCSFVQFRLIHIYQQSYVISLLGINILGDSYIHNIACSEMYFYYNNTIAGLNISRHKLLVSHYHIINRFKGKYGIYLNMSQYSYKNLIIFHLLNTFIRNQKLEKSVFLYAKSSNPAIQNSAHC